MNPHYVRDFMNTVVVTMGAGNVGDVGRRFLSKA